MLSACHQTSDPATMADRIETLDWPAVRASLDERGWAVLPRLLGPEECERVRALDEQDSAFRSRIVMARHGFGRGSYGYFGYPLPPLVAALRTALYIPLAPVANRWHERLGIGARFPAKLDAFLGRCHAAGQLRPTPLLLRYGQGDHNNLHQDLYGDHVFPLQAAILLSAPGADFDGGEFVLTEQRPRMQSRASVVPFQQGDAVVFAVNFRPVTGARGDFRASLRHGVSEIRGGRRLTLGIIFHDAS